MAVAFCIAGGFVLGDFVRRVRPVDYLLRPLLVAAGLAVIIGLVSGLFRRWSIPVAAFVAAWIMRPAAPATLALAAVLVGLLFYRIRTRRTPTIDVPLSVAAVVFLAAGLAPVVPMLSWSTSARATDGYKGPPQYAILLDGYPRVDTLASYGLDISPFLDELEERGFVVYREATSKHMHTFGTLTALLDGEGPSGTISQQRETRTTWRLPNGWSYIAPPAGNVIIPKAPRLNPGGFTFFEAELMARSLPRHLLGDMMMDGYRSKLDQALELLASTRQRRVFAHIFAPHVPILYTADGTPLGAPECYPGCPHHDELGSMAGYIEWLNGKLLEIIDGIFVRRPDAEIVLFSDHGGRFDNSDFDEWTRTFLASRTPTRPDLFGESPHPHRIFDLMADRSG